MWKCQPLTAFSRKTVEPAAFNSDALASYDKYLYTRAPLQRSLLLLIDSQVLSRVNFARIEREWAANALTSSSPSLQLTSRAGRKDDMKRGSHYGCQLHTLYPQHGFQ